MGWPLLSIVGEDSIYRDQRLSIEFGPAALAREFPHLSIDVSNVQAARPVAETGISLAEFPPMPQPTTGPKLLYRRLDSLFGSMDHRRPPRRLMEAFMEDLLKTLGQDMGWLTGRLYGERGPRFLLLKRAGEPGPPERRELPSDIAAVDLLLQHRTYVYADPEALASPAKAGILPAGSAAGIVVGQSPDRYLFFI